jgi:Effector-associated domain 11
LYDTFNSTHKMKQTLRDLIAAGKTKQAITELLARTTHDTDWHHRVIQLSARYATYEQQYLGKLEDSTVLGVELADINHALLHLIDQMNGTTTAALFSFKTVLYLLSVVLVVAAVYYLYGWYKAEPNNKEPLPALLSTLASLVAIVLTWRYDGDGGGSKRNSSFWRQNKAVIKGNKNTIQQGTNDAQSTIETNNAHIEGDENNLKQN